MAVSYCFVLVAFIVGILELQPCFAQGWKKNSSRSVSPAQDLSDLETTSLEVPRRPTTSYSSDSSHYIEGGAQGTHRRFTRQLSDEANSDLEASDELSGASIRSVPSATGVKVMFRVDPSKTSATGKSTHIANSYLPIFHHSSVPVSSECMVADMSDIYLDLNTEQQNKVKEKLVGDVYAASNELAQQIRDAEHQRDDLRAKLDAIKRRVDTKVGIIPARDEAAAAIAKIAGNKQGLADKKASLEANERRIADLVRESNLLERSIKRKEVYAKDLQHEKERADQKVLLCCKSLAEELGGDKQYNELSSEVECTIRNLELLKIEEQGELDDVFSKLDGGRVHRVVTGDATEQDVQSFDTKTYNDFIRATEAVGVEHVEREPMPRIGLSVIGGSMQDFFTGARKMSQPKQPKSKRSMRSRNRARKNRRVERHSRKNR